MSSTRNLPSFNNVRVTSPVKLRHQPSNSDITNDATSTSKRQVKYVIFYLQFKKYMF